ncbi:MAG: hypothetical protein KAS32_08780 [Candidatus Peribacteraceae bacterium]|nr:hypothetical protein [Candidatus Peribacteraceae bacterium]
MNSSDEIKVILTVEHGLLLRSCDKYDGAVYASLREFELVYDSNRLEYYLTVVGGSSFYGTKNGPIIIIGSNQYEHVGSKMVRVVGI